MHFSWFLLLFPCVVIVFPWWGACATLTFDNERSEAANVTPFPRPFPSYRANDRNTGVDVASVGNNISPSEMQALNDLYSSTNGSDWNCCESGGVAWNFSANANPCLDNWQGVGCSYDEIRGVYNIANITLVQSNLRGTLPSSIDSLSHLELLDVNINFISGSIPITLTNLTSLLSLDLSENYLYGTIPHGCGDLQLLETLNLQHNLLTGPVPSSIGQVLSLGNLGLAFNSLTGTIPLSIGNLTNLQYLYFGYNTFDGSIPDSLGDLLKIITLTIYYNAVSGTIPSSFGNFLDMSYLYLNDNHLVGTVPPSLGNCTNLYSMILDSNSLTGTIPSAIGYLPHLALVYLEYNSFHGTIPSSFANLTEVQILAVDSNYISGVIPDMSNCVVMSGLYVGVNDLTGTLPSWLGDLTLLQNLVIDYNSMTGTIPEGFGNLIKLGSLFLGNSCFSGTIPNSIGNLTMLDSLSLSYAYLTGSLPPALGNNLQIVSFVASNNRFIGVLPSSLGNLLKMQVFMVNNNELTGTIPGTYGKLQSIVQFELDSNKLNGGIPSFVSNWTLLSEFILNNNQFSGSLESVFNSSTQLYLYSIQVSNNQLTGTLPEDIFNIVPLSTFVVNTNCFHGTLPSTICRSSRMVSLIMDGMSSATSCRDLILPGISSSYTLTKSVIGSIPSCLLQLPNLTTLHMSGNEFSGSLPNVLEVSPSLSDLTVSHNFLYGDIGDSIQELEWFNLDLSFNRLSGVLISNFASISVNGQAQQSNASLSLQNNRLSGRIPGSIHNMLNISILGSNIFSCDILGNNLPANDPSKQGYQCGSSAFDIPYYLLLSLIFVACLVAFVCWYWRIQLDRYFQTSDMIKKFQIWSNNCQSTSAATALDRFNNVLMFMCKISGYCVLYISLLFFPLYWALSSSYGTYTYEYDYVVSAAFLSGIVPFSLEFLFFICLLLGFLLLCHSLFAEHFSFDESSLSGGYELAVSWYQKFMVYFCFIFVNVVIVGGVNALYVYAAIYEESSVLLAEQIVVSFFKILWNRVMLRALLIEIARLFLPPVSSVSLINKKFLTLQICVSLINNILIPCVAVAGISPSCFYNLVVAAPSLSSSYSYASCLLSYVSGECSEEVLVTVETSYDPPYAYSDECSSSFITYYAPIFVSLCITSSFVIPAVKVFLLLMNKRCMKGGCCFKFVDMMLPRILRPLLPPTDEALENNFFRADLLFLTLSTNMGLLLTFGVVFPPLAVGFGFSICVVVYTSRLEVGRFIELAKDNNYPEYVDKVTKECQGVGNVSALRKVMWMVTTASCLFYTLFLFDTLGDKVGFNNSFWVVIALPSLPLVMYSIEQYLLLNDPPHAPWIRRKDSTTSMDRRVSRAGDFSVEMRPSNRTSRTVSTPLDNHLDATAFNNPLHGVTPLL